MYHDLPSRCQFLVVPADKLHAIILRGGNPASKAVRVVAASTVPTTSASREGLPAGSPEPQCLLVLELLLRSRRLQEVSNAPLGALPGPKGLPWPPSSSWSARCGRGPLCGESVSSPNASMPRKHNHPLADLLVRTFPTNVLLEGRTRYF